jgi:ABC-type phosphate/phosphonate transport system substrate-binding protein
VKAVKAALLELHEAPDGATVLERFGAQRFIETSAADYRPVAEMAQRAGIDLRSYEYVNR